MSPGVPVEGGQAEVVQQTQDGGGLRQSAAVVKAALGILGAGRQRDTRGDTGVRRRGRPGPDVPRTSYEQMWRHDQLWMRL